MKEERQVISHEKWLEKVDNELKGKKTTEDLIHFYNTGLILNPTAPEETKIHNIKSFPPELRIGLVTSQTSTSEDLLSLLKVGVNTLIYNDPVSDSDKYREVVTDYIDIIAESTDHLATREEIWPGLKTSTVVSGNIHISQNNIWQKIASPLFGGADACIRIVLSDDILHNISVLRAIRWVAEKTDNKITLIGEASVTDGEKEQSLIQASSQAMSFRMGGGDIFIPPSEETSIVQLKRYIHILNIMSMESNMNAASDPCRGAYTIESLTAQAIQKIEEAAPARESNITK